MKLGPTTRGALEKCPGLFDAHIGMVASIGVSGKTQ
jgi:hypothetical protein